MSLEKRQQRKANRLAKQVRKADEAAGIAGKTVDYNNEDENQDVIFNDVTKSDSSDENPDTSHYTFPKEENESTSIPTEGVALINATKGYTTGGQNMNIITGAGLYDKTVMNNKSISFNDAQELADSSAKVDDTKKAIQAETQNAISEQLKGIQDNLETESEDETPTEKGAEEEVQGTKEVIGTTSTQLPIGGLVSEGSPSAPSYTATTTKDQAAKDITNVAKQATEADFNLPEAVVEELGVQDYYPNIGKDIAVGTWTGARLGSQTIYAGGGALLPMGLYDARKRALNEAAKQRQAFIDKIYDLPNTSDQYNVKYQDYGYDFIDKSLENYGSYEAMAKDPKWRREMARITNMGKEIMYTDKYADNLLKDAGDKEKYVPIETIKRAMKFKNGMVDNLDEILSGSKSAANETQYFRSYESGTAHVDELVKNGIFDENRLSQVPINLKTGGKYDEATFQKEKNDFLQTMHLTKDKDVLITGLKKYFDTSQAEGMINSWFDSNNADPATKESVLNYMLAQIPTQVVLDKTVMDTKNFEREKLASDNYHWERKQKMLEEEGKSHYTVKNEMLTGTDSEGKTLNQRYAEISSDKSLSKEKKAAKMKEAFNLFTGGKSVWSPFAKTAVMEVPAPAEMSSKTMNVNSRQMKTMLIKKGKGKGVGVEYTASEFAKMSNDFIVKNFTQANGKPFTAKGVNDIKNAIKTERLAMNAQVLQTAVGHVDAAGNLTTITNQNINTFNPNKSRLIERTVGRAVGQGNPIIENGVPLVVDGKQQFESVPLEGTFFFETNMSDASGRNSLDSNFGSTAYKISKEGSQNSSYEGSSSGGPQ